MLYPTLYCYSLVVHTPIVAASFGLLGVNGRCQRNRTF